MLSISIVKSKIILPLVEACSIKPYKIVPHKAQFHEKINCTST